jgi:hypothetical protein
VKCGGDVNFVRVHGRGHYHVEVDAVVTCAVLVLDTSSPVCSQ